MIEQAATAAEGGGGLAGFGFGGRFARLNTGSHVAAAVGALGLVAAVSAHGFAAVARGLGLGVGGGCSSGSAGCGGCGGGRRVLGGWAPPVCLRLLRRARA